MVTIYKNLRIDITKNCFGYEQEICENDSILDACKEKVVTNRILKTVSQSYFSVVNARGKNVHIHYFLSGSKTTLLNYLLVKVKKNNIPK